MMAQLDVNENLRHSTLDEPVMDTIVRDFLAIGRKMLIVLVPPMGSQHELRDWELWGPLLICLTHAIILSSTAESGQGGLIFSAIFVLVWLGAAVVTLNAKFLGSRLSFFQTVCVMGYCMAPLCLGALLCLLVNHFWWSFLISAIGWSWSCWASQRFIRGSISGEREVLALYPVGLFYFFMAWMVAVGV
ncbi:Yip1 domain [Trypanosoma vivax]|uniref:Protein YIPF n=1 Tax=Trypanosoma vivax (strain Y486) TaxID=1055687 RepID=G0U0G2_TRYVY|nr:putative terbinafine resistance locus protein (yip1) [Trypanosoma vivax]KAH8610952.1 Yip1 domain [Trypanosoma vivax]CCC49560.1 putative terbinafine resistance locus protein (yip1) [Trypanosoma vivax Y486]